MELFRAGLYFLQAFLKKMHFLMLKSALQGTDADGRLEEIVHIQMTGLMSRLASIHCKHLVLSKIALLENLSHCPIFLLVANLNLFVE